MLKRLVLIALPLLAETPAIRDGEKTISGAPTGPVSLPSHWVAGKDMMGKATPETTPNPKALTDAQRADYATAIARVAIAQARMAEARSAFLEAQAQHEALMKAARAEIEKLRKANGAASVCEIDLEGKWQCATGSR